MTDFRGHDYKGYQLWDDDTALIDAVGTKLAVGDIVVAAVQWGPGGVMQRLARITGGGGTRPIEIEIISAERDGTRSLTIRNSQLVRHSIEYRDVHPVLVRDIFTTERQHFTS